MKSDVKKYIFSNLLTENTLEYTRSRQILRNGQTLTIIRTCSRKNKSFRKKFYIDQKYTLNQTCIPHICKNNIKKILMNDFSRRCFKNYNWSGNFFKG